MKSHATVRQPNEPEGIMQYTKRTARELLNTNDFGLARFFNITAGAVHRWGEDKPLPAWRSERLEKVTKSELKEGAAWRTRPVRHQTGRKRK